jgi:hypothetical protein
LLRRRRDEEAAADVAVVPAETTSHVRVLEAPGADPWELGFDGDEPIEDDAEPAPSRGKRRR